MSNESRHLAETIYGIDRLANSLATTPQLTNSSIAGDLDFTDGDGNPVGSIGGDGKGGIGTKPFVDPTPPMPSVPEVTGDAGFMRVRWDGLWADAEDPRVPADPSVVVDADVQVIEVHASLDPNFTPDRAYTYAGNFAGNADGGSIIIGPLVESGEYWVALRARSITGMVGELSGKIPINLSGVQIDNKLFELALRDDEIRKTADGKNEVLYGDTEPEPHPVLDEEGNPVYDTDGNQLFEEFSDNDLWFGPGNMPHLYDEATGQWVSAGDARVDAIKQAQDELREDLDTVIVDGSGMKSFYRATEPTVEESSEGDLWFDISTDGNNVPHIFHDGAWLSIADARVSAIADAQDALAGEVTAVEARAAAEAKSLADDALAAANSHTDGRVFDSTQIADDAITTPKIKAGAVGAVAIAAESIEGKHVKAGSITADKVLIGQGGNLLSNPTFADGAAGWSSSPDVRPGTGKDGSDAILIPATTKTSGHYLGVSSSDSGYRFAVTPREEYRVSAYAAAEEGIVSGGARIYVRFYTPQDNAEGTWSWGSPSSIENTDAIEAFMWGQVDGIVTAPEGAIECVVGLYSNSTHTHIMRWCLPSAQQAVGSTLIQDGAVTTNKILAGSITAESGIIGSINAGTILFGEMDGARIKANSIAADKVLIGGEANFFARGVVNSEADVEAWPGDPEYRADGPDGVGGAAAYPAGQWTTGFESMGRFTVTPGNMIAFEVNVASLGADSNIYFEVRNQDGKLINGWEALPGPSEFEGGFSYPVQSAALTSSWRLLGAQINVPPDTHEIYLSKVYFNHTSGPTQDGEVWVSGLKLYRLTTSTLIADGAITTGKIATGAITAESGIIGSLDAGVITTGELRGELIRAGSIAAAAIAGDAIDGKTITGAEIRTASAGARVEMNNNGLTQYNQFGQVMTEMSGGVFSAVGSFQTGFQGERRVIVDNNLWGNGAGIMFVPEGANLSQEDYQHQSRIGSPSKGNLELASQELSDGIRNRLQIRSTTGTRLDSIRMSGLTPIGPHASVGAGPLWRNGDGEDQGGAWMSVGEEYDNNKGRYTAQTYMAAVPPGATNHWTGGSGNDIRVRSSADTRMSAGGNINIQSNGGDVRLAPGGGKTLDFYARNRLKITALPNRSGSGTMPLRISTDWMVSYEGSSRRYKLAEESLLDTAPDLEEQLLSIDAKTWFDKGCTERYAAYLDATAKGETPDDDLAGVGDLARSPGVIAEDLDEAGLGLFVVYNPDGTPESVLYDRIGPALIPIVRNQRDRITALESRLSALEAA